MFFLKPADGAIGSRFAAVHGVYRDFKADAQAIAAKTGLLLP